MNSYEEDLVQFKEWEHVLDIYTKQKNILTESEFSKYEILYRAPKKSMETVDDLKYRDKLVALSNDFFNRINPYDEITIVSDSDKSKVVAVLPRPFMQVQVLRSDVASAITDYASKGSIPFRRDLRDEAATNLMHAIAVSQDIYHDPSIKEQARSRYAELSKSLLEGTTPSNQQAGNVASITVPPSNTIKTSTTDVDWAFDED